MLRALFILILLSLAAGAGWIAFSFHRVKSDRPLLPLDEAVARLDSYLSAPTTNARIAEQLSAFLDRHLGRCVPVLPPSEFDPTHKLRQIPGASFPIARPVRLANRGGLCEFHGFGSSFLAMSSPNESTLAISRSWTYPPTLRLDSGGIQFSSGKAWIELEIPGMNLELKSAGPVRFFLVREPERFSLSITQGQINLEFLRTPRGHAMILPLSITTAKGSAVTSGGEKKAADGQIATLLPSGFTLFEPEKQLVLPPQNISPVEQKPTGPIQEPKK